MVKWYEAGQDPEPFWRGGGVPVVMGEAVVWAFKPGGDDAAGGGSRGARLSRGDWGNVEVEFFGGESGGSLAAVVSLAAGATLAGAIVDIYASYGDG